MIASKSLRNEKEPRDYTSSLAEYTIMRRIGRMGVIPQFVLHQYNLCCWNQVFWESARAGSRLLPPSVTLG